MTVTKEWFAEWFDTPYYHTLYKDRDHREAEEFIDKLIQYLSPAKNAHVLDLACGKGRHAIHLNQLGYQVTGVDLSEQSITAASKFSNNRLAFFVHDMRDLLEKEKYNYIFNLFTSFGYFNNLADNQKVIDSIYNGLKPQGCVVIDFMNAEKVINGLKAKEQKIVDGITFNIERKIENEIIIKDIAFEDKGKKYRFQERVQAIKKLDFETMINKSNLTIEGYFGDYQLNPFDVINSDRLIIVAKKS